MNSTFGVKALVVYQVTDSTEQSMGQVRLVGQQSVRTNSSEPVFARFLEAASSGGVTSSSGGGTSIEEVVRKEQVQERRVEAPPQAECSEPIEHQR